MLNLNSLFLSDAEFYYLPPIRTRSALSLSALQLTSIKVDGFEAAKVYECGPFTAGCLKKNGETVLGFVRRPDGILAYVKKNTVFASYASNCEKGKTIKVGLRCLKFGETGDYDLAQHFDKLFPGWVKVPNTTLIPLVAGMLATVAVSELVFLALSAK